MKERGKPGEGRKRKRQINDRGTAEEEKKKNEGEKHLKEGKIHGKVERNYATKNYLLGYVEQHPKRCERC